MTIDDVRALVQDRLNDAREINRARHERGDVQRPWDVGYVVALQQILDDMKNFEAQDDDSYEYAWRDDRYHVWPYGPRDEEEGAPKEEVLSAPTEDWWPHDLSEGLRFCRRTKAVPAGEWEPADV